MKKSMLFGSFVMLALFPAYLSAQEIELPTVEVKVTQDKVPAVVKEAILNDFGESHSPVWVTRDSHFDTFDWQQSTNIDNMDVYNYSIHTKTNRGSTLDAFYTAKGQRINSIEHLKNFRPEQSVIMALQNSEYKDWVISSDFLIRKVLSNGKEKERYAIVLQKGNEKKTVYINMHGNLSDKKLVDLADANW